MGKIDVTNLNFEDTIFVVSLPKGFGQFVTF
jgi:hypothetical protein